ncbi:hypothetical protein OSB04_022466 [Centaurea solstitialis]|uniref:WRKY domain-containing protein n=1 Tax=Centaurea solstitialis TaxID=347529 RepID=A0AA38TG30_9ASTR|nr:hypothetical protein OSB04_022466 [Centaurea solstitialis]
MLPIIHTYINSSITYKKESAINLLSSSSYYLHFSSRKSLTNQSSMADWALQAMIKPNHEYHHDHHHHEDQAFGSIDIKKEYDQALLFCYPHLFDQEITNTRGVVGGELDQLYKPFYPSLCDDNIEFPPPSLPPNDLQAIHHNHHHHGFDQEVQQHQDQEKNIKILCGSTSNTSQVAPKLKKRKNQQKRVVVQVTADGLSSDPWAWRKYGQKPIKGSIYPRSYYRCSSSKGCMARRQVEQSCTDPSIYILTYTADHNHAQPTRRNSLAGITRNRFKIAPKSPTISDGGKTVTISKDSPFHSPTTPSVSSSIEDEVLQQSNIKQETTFYNKFDDQEHTMMNGFNDDDFMIFRDDFFEDLEDLGGFKMDSSSYNCSNQQFPNVFS